jgi:O-antigen/teichoic acid export membrane protein
MTSSLDNGARSAGDRARALAYQRDFWPGMVGYALVLTAVLLWGRLDGTSPWRWLWSVLPVLPALLVVRAVARHLRRIDEYQRGLLLQALSVGFGVAMVTAVTMGFLGIAGLSGTVTGWIVYGAGMLGWIVGGAVVGRSAGRP